MSPGSAPDSGHLFWLVVFIGVVLIQRVVELLHSARTGRVLRARGAKEYGAAHFPLLVIVHVLFPVALVMEVVVLGAHPGSWWPVWLTLWCLAQSLRYWAVLTLGERWNVRILILPGLAPVRRGPYAYLNHPNY
ncbi:MAG: isoprenylcysteine carboxylmethyltransferase family protein, partial [Candidatus Eisenbacteria bacterium]